MVAHVHSKLGIDHDGDCRYGRHRSNHLCRLSVRPRARPKARVTEAFAKTLPPTEAFFTTKNRPEIGRFYCLSFRVISRQRNMKNSRGDLHTSINRMIQNRHPYIRTQCHANGFDWERLKIVLTELLSCH